MIQPHKNSFSKGLNTDIDKNNLESDSYIEAHNVELVSNGGFLSLKNIVGTTTLETITGTTGTEVLKVVDNFYKIDTTTGIKCLTIFTAKNSGNFKIWCYDTENDDLYELYEEAVGADYITNHRIVDAKSYAENGIDILYFTDFLGEIRQLRCEIPTVFLATPNFLTESDLSLQRRGANGTIDLIAVASTGGTLLSGSYQFAYRMADPDTKKYTKWSSLTNPIHVYSADPDSYRIAWAGIGLPTSKSIQVLITPTDIELDNFGYYQLAVVENIYPTGAESVTSGTNQSFVASLLDITSTGSLTYTHKSNTKVGTIPIEDLVVDLAPIETAKTLTIAQNKLFLGNIKYRDLDYDNGSPTATGSIITTALDISSPITSNILYYNEYYSSVHRGHFRGEVYRYGIVYFDKYGNKSAPVVLDLNNIADNQISGTIPDVKFPERHTATKWSILNANNAPVGLGLELTIDNHPTWAAGFEIVRAKRIKRVMFQTPVIPMMGVDGIGVMNYYPSRVTIGDTDEEYKEFADAQPMTSSKVYIPKNLFWPELRDIGKRETKVTTSIPYVGTSRNYRKKGESKLRYRDTYNYACIFPQQDLYEKSAYNYIGNEKLQTVDYCLLKLDHEEFDAKTNNSYSYAGNQINTKVTGNFYALANEAYYSYAGSTFDDPNPITDYISIPQGSEGTTLGGEKVLSYGDLATTAGATGWNYTPTAQAMSVVRLQNDFEDEGSHARTYSANSQLAYGSGGGRFISGSGIYYQVEGSEDNGDSTAYRYTNKYVFKYTHGTTYSSSHYVQSIRICNVVREEIGDSRYGDVGTQHEFISTGTKHSFSALELADVEAANPTPITVEVWGGDCFVSHHTFKICDSTYSVIDQDKNNNNHEPVDDVLVNWNDMWYGIGISGTNPNPALMMPVALEKVAQFVQVYLESEYNGGVMDNDILKVVGTVTGSTTPILNVTKESDLKTPLTYNHNINLSKQNDQKVYFVKPNYFVEQNDFGARILISDQKVYNSDTQGFDVFKVLNFTDLEESRGTITALRLAGDRLYAVQEKSISDLPLGQSQIEQTDAGILSVGTGSTLGRPIVIDSNRGGQHLASIAESGGLLYIPDNRNKAVYQVGGQEMRVISSNGNDTLFRDFFATEIPERELVTVYDPIKKQYWLSSNDNTYVYNEMANLWVGNLEFDGNLKGGVSTNQTLYLIGKISDQVNVYSMYTGNYSTLFGQTVTPRVTFVVNPAPDFSKTFDNQMIVATERLASIDYEVERESAYGSQTGTILVDNTTIEGNFRVKTMRDADDARFRGLRLLTTLNWKTDNVGSLVSSVFTKVRLSSRSLF